MTSRGDRRSGDPLATGDVGSPRSPSRPADARDSALRPGRLRHGRRRAAAAGVAAAGPGPGSDRRPAAQPLSGRSGASGFFGAGVLPAQPARASAAGGGGATGPARRQAATPRRPEQPRRRTDAAARPPASPPSRRRACPPTRPSRTRRTSRPRRISVSQNSPNGPAQRHRAPGRDSRGHVARTTTFGLAGRGARSTVRRRTSRWTIRITSAGSRLRRRPRASSSAGRELTPGGGSPSSGDGGADGGGGGRHDHAGRRRQRRHLRPGLAVPAVAPDGAPYSSGPVAGSTTAAPFNTLNALILSYIDQRPVQHRRRPTPAAATSPPRPRACRSPPSDGLGTYHLQRQRPVTTSMASTSPAASARPTTRP